MDEIRVLIINDSLVRGGRERRLIELLKRIDKNPSIKASVVLLKDLIQYPEIYGLKNIKLSVIRRKIKKDPTVFFRLYKICQSERPDIIHSWGSMPSVYTFLTAKILGIKFINAMIPDAVCPRFGKSWWRKKLTFPFSDVIVSNSIAGIKAYDVPEKKALVINNGFDFNRIQGIEDPVVVREKFGIRTKYVVGMVAAFSIYKDYDTIIDAAVQILKKGLDVTFMLVGDGENLGYYKAKVKDKWGKRILFPGNLENVESVVNIFDIGVLTTYTEGISNSIMEYMALGKPVIATEGGGTNEIILNNETGFIIEHGSVKQLVKKIQYLLASPEIMLKMGRLGRKRVEEKFSIDRMVNRTYDMYYNILKK